MSCLMNFGELNIPSSRAFWDDCEEDEFDSIEAAEKLQLKFDSGADESPIASDLFVLIEGPLIADFSKGALLSDTDTKLVCNIPSKTSALHFNASKNQLLAVLEEELTSSGEIAELLIPYAQQAKQLLTVTIKPKVEYKSEEIGKYSDDIAIVRAVGVNAADVVELEAPNFIAGVAAGIASWREQLELPVSSYVIYTDKLPLDGTAAKPVLKLLQKLGVACGASYAPPRRDNSYLYL